MQLGKYTKYLEWTVMLVLLFGILKISKDYGFIENLKPDTKSGKIIMMTGIFLMAFIVLAAHELGHLIVGLMNGFRFELFVVGPLGIKRENNHIKLYLNKDLAYYGGVAATSPIDDHSDNAKKFAHILLAGPIASIIFAFICFGLAQLLAKPLGMILFSGGLISIAIFLATTIPSQTGMFFTDRKRYQRLVNPGKDREIELAMLRIMGRYSRDNSYKNVDKNDIDILVSDDLPFIQYYGLFNRLCYQLENDGIYDDKTLNDYELHATKMPKNLVLAFQKELDKLKESLIQINDIQP